MTETTDEFVLPFWKIHILHHAANGPVYGLWLLQELAQHGYRVSPGTLYPLLARMERAGLLRVESSNHARARRTYRITPEGRKLLRKLRRRIEELHHEVVRNK
jgi:DNA-binding PadR family transcriptional regulator